MLSKEVIKARLCIETSSKDFPLATFLEWVDLQCRRQVLRYLEEIEQEFQVEEQTWREAAAFGNVSKAQAQVRYWSFHCRQLMAYYQAVIDDPKNKKHFRSLLRSRERQSRH